MNDGEIRHRRSDTKLSKMSNISRSYGNDIFDKKVISKRSNSRFPDDNNDDDKRFIVTKTRRTNSATSLLSYNSPRSSNGQMNTLKERKSSTLKKHHHSSNSRNHSKKDNYLEYDFADDEVHNDVFFPKYIPKINTMKEYKFLKITLILTCLAIGFIIIMSVVLRLKINDISKEVKNIQNDLPFSTNAYDFSTLLSKKGNEDMKVIAKNKKTLEKIKELSQKTGLSIPQLLNIDWNEYELVN